VEPHCLAGCDFDGFSGSCIPPLACGPRRRIETAKAGDIDRLAGQEANENGVYHSPYRLAAAAWFSSVASATFSITLSVIGGPGSDFISGVAGLGSHCRHTRFHLSHALMLSNPRTKAYRPANKFNKRNRFTPH
jgi:hypothetical protein